MIGLCSVTFREESVEEVVRLAQQANLDLIEWGSDGHVPQTDKKQAEKVARLMKEAGLRSKSYGTYYRLGSGEDFTDYMDVAKILGASTLRVWAGEKGSAEATSEERVQVIEDAKRLGELAAVEGMTIALEYHSKTLTDTPDSAVQLMEEIEMENVLLYWQPAEVLTVQERIESLPQLTPWITNVHVFNWENYLNRFPLVEAADAWKQYIELIKKYSPHEVNYFLEFVPGDDPIEGFFESADTLKNWLQA